MDKTVILSSDLGPDGLDAIPPTEDTQWFWLGDTLPEDGNWECCGYLSPLAFQVIAARANGGTKVSCWWRKKP
jgi:hypothetical protein